MDTKQDIIFNNDGSVTRVIEVVFDCSGSVEIDIGQFGFEFDLTSSLPEEYALENASSPSNPETCTHSVAHFSAVLGCCLKCNPDKDPRNNSSLWGVI